MLATTAGLDDAREVEKYLGFEFVLWESDRAKGRRENEKRES